MNMLLRLRWQVVWSFPGCSFCALLVAWFSCQSIENCIGETAFIIPMVISNRTLRPLVILLVDDSDMVSFIGHGCCSNVQQSRLGDFEEVVRSTKCWPGSLVSCTLVVHLTALYRYMEHDFYSQIYCYLN